MPGFDLVVLIFALQVSQLTNETTGKALPAVQSLAISHRANKDSFRFGKVRFELRKGIASSDEDALAGRFSKSYLAHGLYIFDGKNTKYELLYNAQDVASTSMRTGENEIKSFLTPIRMLCDGNVTLVDLLAPDDSGTELESHPIIKEGSQAFEKSFFFPVWIGQGTAGPWDLDKSCELLEAGKCTVKQIDFDSRLNGVDVCKIDLDFGGGSSRTIWVDMDRGAVALRIEDAQESRITHAHVNEKIRFVPGAGWLPMVSRSSIQNGTISHEIRLVAIDVGDRPSDEAFQLDFPNPVELYDIHRQVLYRPRKTWNLLRLPRRGSPDAEYMPLRISGRPPEMPEELTSINHWHQILVASVVILVCFPVIRAFLRRH